MGEKKEQIFGAFSTIKMVECERLLLLLSSELQKKLAEQCFCNRFNGFASMLQGDQFNLPNRPSIKF